VLRPRVIVEDAWLLAQAIVGKRQAEGRFHLLTVKRNILSKLEKLKAPSSIISEYKDEVRETEMKLEAMQMGG
jgi:hypothetical protein